MAAAASAQPRRVEVWGNVGAARAAGDEGSIGSGLTVGGGLLIPFARHWAFDVDALRMTAERFDSTTRVLVSPAILYRGGSGPLYGFVGGGIGLQADRDRFAVVEGGTLVRRKTTRYDRSVHARAGFVASPSNHVILRAEFFTAWTYALPTFGAKIGIGARF